ncbi:hypothetical protein E2C01_062770 [Portunus trituberculatus]|uniref:Uncharacterized protein n=1 Tax=Portunus trituberculatus TaxID=210409 RepID=A0A5B7HI90_PORTR|nr:hypothetical protein [Portunus trituberculatus]
MTAALGVLRFPLHKDELGRSAPACLPGRRPVFVPATERRLRNVLLRHLVESQNRTMAVLVTCSSKRSLFPPAAHRLQYFYSYHLVQPTRPCPGRMVTCVGVEERRTSSYQGR